MQYTITSPKTGKTQTVDEEMKYQLMEGLGYPDSAFRPVPVTAPLADTPRVQPTVRESTQAGLDAVSGAGKYVPPKKRSSVSVSDFASPLRVVDMLTKPIRDRVAADPTSPLAETVRDFFPATAKAVEERGSKLPLWAGVRDVATLPMRAGAEVVMNAADMFAGQPVIPGKMRAPTKAINDYGEAGFLPTAAAEATEDPTFLPTLALGAPTGLLKTAALGLGLGAGTYGTHVADRYQLEGQGFRDALANETGSQVAQDVMPLVLPLALKGAGTALKSDFNPLTWFGRNLGKAGKERAYELMTAAVKPPPALKGGSVHEGFTEGIRGSIEGKPILPMLIPEGTRSVKEIPENYLKLKAKHTAGIEPAMKALEDAGVRVDRNKVFEAARNAMVEEQAKGTKRAFTHTQQQKALGELFDRLYVHEDPILQRWASSLRAGLKGEHGFVPPKPVAYDVTSFNRVPRVTTRELTEAERAIMTPEEIAAFTAEEGANRVKALEGLSSQRRITPEQYGKLLESGTISPARHENLPFDLKAKLGPRPEKSIPGSYTQPLYEFPTGELKPLGHAFEYAPLGPRFGQNLKSNLYQEAYKNLDEPDLAIEEVARHAAAEIRRQLTEPSELTLESVLGAHRARKAAPSYKYESKLPSETFDPSDVERLFAGPGDGLTANEARALYKAEMQKVAPIYAMGDAMERAKHTLPNRFDESKFRHSFWDLFKGPSAARGYLQYEPGYIRGVHNYGEMTEPMARRAAAFLAGIDNLAQSSSKVKSAVGKSAKGLARLGAAAASAKAPLGVAGARAKYGADRDEEMDVGSLSAILQLASDVAKSDTTKTKSKKEK